MDTAITVGGWGVVVVALLAMWGKPILDFIRSKSGAVAGGVSSPEPQFDVSAFVHLEALDAYMADNGVDVTTRKGHLDPILPLLMKHQDSATSVPVNSVTAPASVKP